jgi:hypothetical protein
MSDVITKRRPMIDLDEFERRLGRPCATDQRDGDPLAELLRIIGDKDEPHKTDFEPKTQLSAMARPDAGEPGEWKQADALVHLVGGDFAAVEAGLLGTKQPEATILRAAERSTVEYKRPAARAPLLSGDFAAIEAGLLGALREQATATVPETDMANAFPSVDLGSERRLYQHDQPAFGRTGVADGQIKSRRRRYVIGAIVFVGMTGVAVSFGLNSRLSGPTDIASIKADNGPNKPQTEAMSSADVPAQDTAILSESSEPSSMALDKGTEQPLDLTQAEKKTLPAESHAQLDNGPAAVPAATAPAESLSEVAPPQANINGALLPAPQSFAAAKAPTVKAPGRVAKPLKPAAARHPGSHGQPRQIANKDKATSVSPLTTKPAPSADPKAETPTTQPSQATNGTFGFVQSAVNSLTSTTAKLFEWGRN